MKRHFRGAMVMRIRASSEAIFGSRSPVGIRVKIVARLETACSHFRSLMRPPDACVLLGQLIRWSFGASIEDTSVEDTLARGHMHR